MDLNVTRSVSTPPSRTADEPAPVTSEMKLHLIDGHEWSAGIHWQVHEISKAGTILVRWNDDMVLERYSVQGLLGSRLPQQAINLLRANGVCVPMSVVKRGRH